MRDETRAARLDIDPDTGMWALNRVTSEGRTWKRHRGGIALDAEKAEFPRMGDHPVAPGRDDTLRIDADGRAERAPGTRLHPLSATTVVTLDVVPIRHVETTLGRAIRYATIKQNKAGVVPVPTVLRR